MSFMDQAKDFAEQHDEKIDEGLEKAGDQIDDRTGGKYSSHLDKGVDQAQQRTGGGDTQEAAQGGEDPGAEDPGAESRGTEDPGGQ